MNPLLVCAFILFAAQQSPHVDSLTGVFKGSARNQSGVLQLGGTATNTVFQLQHVADSLHLRALTLSGTERTIASWPLSRVTISGDSFTAKGLPKGPLHLRRTLTWTLSAGIRVSATIRTNAASQKSDDFFGGGEVILTAVKVRD
jgi:hypothetical protein